MKRDPSLEDFNSRKRFSFISSVMLVLVCVAFVRLTLVQLFDCEGLHRIADQRGRRHLVIEPLRGMIYSRDGLPLTENLGNYLTIAINKYKLLDPERLASDLELVTGRNRNFYLKLLSSKAYEVTLDRKISPVQAEQLRDLGWSLIEKPDFCRAYPYNNVAGQIVGFGDPDLNGVSGIELVCDSILRGSPGYRVVNVDVNGNPQIRQNLSHKSVVNGGDVVLTIEIALQSILQEEIEMGMKDCDASGGTGIILDPRTGYILAMASKNDYDPNNPESSPTSNQKNGSICDLLELGSVMKSIPMAMLLENQLAEPNSLVDTNPGYISISGKRIHDVHNYGLITLKQTLSKSSNVGMIKFCESISDFDLMKFYSRFGFFEKTGIELPGERVGSVPDVEKWSKIRKPNVLIGQGIAVTPLALAMAYQAIANGGIALNPRIIYGTRKPGHGLEIQPIESGERIISENTAEQLTDFLVDAVNNGTGTRSQIKNVNIAGKTSTASKPDLVNGGYLKSRYLSSFCGYFPAEDPQILILIVIDDPQGGAYYGGLVAAPVFQRIAEKIISFKPEIMRSNVYNEFETKRKIRVRDYCALTLEETKKQIRNDGLKLKVHGRGNVAYYQLPEVDELVETGSVVHITMGPEHELPGGDVIVPRFINNSLRDAICEATSAGLIVTTQGSGLVVKQSLRVGSRAEVGDVCELTAREL
ncbi:MAG: PASTA domain-containing protein [Calditrichaeota bacterium]|nr:PASTA domain-containing protein [Calditrichota bacterium]